MSTDNKALARRWFEEVWNTRRRELSRVGGGGQEFAVDFHGLFSYATHVLSPHPVFLTTETQGKADVRPF